MTNKLTKAQEKRFKSMCDTEWSCPECVLPGSKRLKQHLASELAKQKEEIIEKLEKYRNKEIINESYGLYVEGYKKATDQAIETIK